jgi:alkaline phosphatase D
MATRNVVYEAAKTCMESGVVPNIIGYTGLGKTDMMKQIAKETGRNLIVLNIATQEPGDLIGVPYIHEEQTYWALPCWWPMDENNLIFVDELNRGRRDTLNAIMPMLLNGELHMKHHLPEGTWMASAMNPNTDEFDMVNSLDDIAVLSRFVHLQLDADFDAWKKWVSTTELNLAPKYDELLSLISTKSILVNNTQVDLEMLNGIKPNPRSWTRFLKILKVFSEKDRTYIPERDQAAIISDISIGLLGRDMNKTLLPFLRQYIETINNKEKSKEATPMETLHNLQFMLDTKFDVSTTEKSDIIYKNIGDGISKFIRTKNENMILKIFENLDANRMYELIKSDPTKFGMLFKQITTPLPTPKKAR